MQLTFTASKPKGCARSDRVAHDKLHTSSAGISIVRVCSAQATYKARGY